MVRDEAAAIVSQYQGIFTKPPTRIPTNLVVDGPLLGNGDVGVTLSGEPQVQRYWIAKNDFWKAKPHWPFSMPCVIGWIDIKFQQLDGTWLDHLGKAPYRVEQKIYEGETITILKRGEVTITLRSWVAATENLLVIEMISDGGWDNEERDLEVHVDVSLTPKSGNGSEITCTPIEDGYLATRKFKGKDLDWETGAAVALRHLRRSPKKLPAPGMGGTSDRFNMVPPGEPVILVASIVTNHDTQEYLETARNRVKDITFAEIEQLRQAHQQWWRDFWAKSFVEIDDKLIEKHWYGSHYILASCSRNENFPPGLYGNWITTDEPGWSGDYHLNYNHQAPWLGVYSSNHVELSEPYDTPILEYLPQGKKFAQELLGVKGVYYNVGIGPKGLDTSSEWSTQGFYGQKSNAVFCTVNMMMRFYHTYDLEYARKVYPFLIEVANFWEDSLKFENGRYIDYDDAENEVGPWQGDNWRHRFGQKNPRRALALIRQFFAGIIDVSLELGVDADRRDKWQHILEHLSEPDNNERILGIVVDAVWPSGVIGLDSEPAILQKAQQQIRAWPEARWAANASSVCHIFAAAARVGYDPDHILSMMRKRIEQCAYPNMWIFQFGGGIECASGVTAGINEMLLQSHEQIIRLFPVWPQTARARFGRLRAVGAFLVSSRVEAQKVQYVCIESEKGRDCTVLNPWPGKNVTLFRSGGKTETLAGERFTFRTSKDEIIWLGPAGVSLEQLQERAYAGPEAFKLNPKASDQSTAKDVQPKLIQLKIKESLKLPQAQSIATDGESLYTFPGRLVKYDLEGNELARGKTDDRHFGGFTYHNGKIYAAVSECTEKGTDQHQVVVFDTASMAIIAEHDVGSYFSTCAGGMETFEGHFYVAESYFDDDHLDTIVKFDEDFNYVDTYRVDFKSSFGIQGLAYLPGLDRFQVNSHGNGFYLIDTHFHSHTLHHGLTALAEFPHGLQDVAYLDENTLLLNANGRDGDLNVVFAELIHPKN